MTRSNACNRHDSKVFWRAKVSRNCQISAGRRPGRGRCDCHSRPPGDYLSCTQLQSHQSADGPSPSCWETQALHLDALLPQLLYTHNNIRREKMLNFQLTTECRRTVDVNNLPSSSSSLDSHTCTLTWLVCAGDHSKNTPKPISKLSVANSQNRHEPSSCVGTLTCDTCKFQL